MNLRTTRRLGTVSHGTVNINIYLTKMLANERKPYFSILLRIKNRLA